MNKEELKEEFSKPSNLEKLKAILKGEFKTESTEKTVEETKEKVNEKTQESTEEQKFVDAQLEDGTIVSIEPDIELGAAVAVMTDEGPVPAPDGQHVLASGMVILTEGGIITDIPEVSEEVAEEEVEEEMAEEVSKEPTPKSVIERTEIEKKFQAQTELIKSLTDKLEKVLSENEGFKNTVVEVVDEFQNTVVEVVEEFKSAPVAETNNKKRKVNPFSKEKKNIFIK